MHLVEVNVFSVMHLVNQALWQDGETCTNEDLFGRLVGEEVVLQDIFPRVLQAVDVRGSV